MKLSPVLLFVKLALSGLVDVYSCMIAGDPCALLSYSQLILYSILCSFITTVYDILT